MADEVIPRQVEEQETVAGQMKGLLEEGSDYTTIAKTSAAETAQSRGLLNTSMAVRAGEAAAIESALPIATADANTYATAGLSAQESGQSIAEDVAKGEITKELASQEYDLKGALSEQEASQAKDIMVTQEGLKMDLAESQAGWDMEIRTMMEENAFSIAAMQDFGQTTRTQLDNTLQQYITEVELDSSEKMAVMSTADGLGQQYQVALTNISTSDLSATAKAGAMADALDAYQKSLTTAANLADINISWR